MRKCGHGVWPQRRQGRLLLVNGIAAFSLPPPGATIREQPRRISLVGGNILQLGGRVLSSGAEASSGGAALARKAWLTPASAFTAFQTQGAPKHCSFDLNYDAGPLSQSS